MMLKRGKFPKGRGSPHSLLKRSKYCGHPVCFQGADLVRLSYCTASAHQVSDGLVRLEPQLLADAGCETPAINYRRFNGKKYRWRKQSLSWVLFLPSRICGSEFSFRYFYAISSDVAIKDPGRLIKIDTQTSKVGGFSGLYSEINWKVVVWKFMRLSRKLSIQVQSWSEENCYCSEPVYISEPGEAQEDSGLLICSLLWGKPRVTTTAILLLSARDLSPIARLESTCVW